MRNPKESYFNLGEDTHEVAYANSLARKISDGTIANGDDFLKFHQDFLATLPEGENLKLHQVDMILRVRQDLYSASYELAVKGQTHFELLKKYMIEARKFLAALPNPPETKS